MNREKGGRLSLYICAGIFVLCAAMTAYYLIAGYGVYLDADMSSELALARHLADEGKLVSDTWVYSTEVRLLSTQLVFTPLMALFGHNWRLVRTLGCLILQGCMAASTYFAGRAMGARKDLAMLFAGLSISACSLVYSQMILIGAYYVPHAVLTNLCVGMMARLRDTENGGKRSKKGLAAVLLAMLCVLMGMSSIRYPFCATLPAAAAAVMLYLFPRNGAAYEKRGKQQVVQAAVVCVLCALSVLGFVFGQRLLGRVCLYDAARYGKMRLIQFNGNNLQQLAQEALVGLVRLMGYREGSILLSVHGLVSVGVLLLLPAAGLLAVRTLRQTKQDAPCFAAMTLLMSAALTFGSFILMENLYINRYWLPLMTLGAPVMAVCLSMERNIPLRRAAVFAFTAVVLVSSAMQIRESMHSPQIRADDRARAAYLMDEGLTFGYATFWHANDTTELTNGEVEVVGIGIEPNNRGEGVPTVNGWLEIQQNRALCRPQEKVFMLLEESEEARLAQFLKRCQAEKVMEQKFMRIWVIPTQQVFFDVCAQMTSD